MPRAGSPPRAATPRKCAPCWPRFSPPCCRSPPAGSMSGRARRCFPAGRRTTTPPHPGPARRSTRPTWRRWSRGSPSGCRTGPTTFAAGACWDAPSPRSDATTRPPAPMAGPPRCCPPTPSSGRGAPRPSPPRAAGRSRPKPSRASPPRSGSIPASRGRGIIWASRPCRRGIGTARWRAGARSKRRRRRTPNGCPCCAGGSRAWPPARPARTWKRRSGWRPKSGRR